MDGVSNKRETSVNGQDTARRHENKIEILRTYTTWTKVLPPIMQEKVKEKRPKRRRENLLVIPNVNDWFDLKMAGLFRATTNKTHHRWSFVLWKEHESGRRRVGRLILVWTLFYVGLEAEGRYVSDPGQKVFVCMFIDRVTKRFVCTRICAWDQTDVEIWINYSSLQHDQHQLIP